MLRTRAVMWLMLRRMKFVFFCVFTLIFLLLSLTAILIKFAPNPVPISNEAILFFAGGWSGLAGCLFVLVFDVVFIELKQTYLWRAMPHYRSSIRRAFVLLIAASWCVFFMASLFMGLPVHGAVILVSLVAYGVGGAGGKLASMFIRLYFVVAALVIGFLCQFMSKMDGHIEVEKGNRGPNLSIDYLFRFTDKSVWFGDLIIVMFTTTLVMLYHFLPVHLTPSWSMWDLYMFSLWAVVYACLISAGEVVNSLPNV